MSDQTDAITTFMSSPYVFEEYELPYDYETCLPIETLATSDDNTNIFSVLVKKIYNITKNVAPITTNEEPEYEVMAQAVNVVKDATTTPPTQKANLVLGFISEKVARSQQVGNKFNKKKNIKAEYQVGGDAYVFAYCIKEIPSDEPGAESKKVPYLKAWKVQKNAVSGMGIYNGSVYLGSTDNDNRIMLGWLDTTGDNATHRFFITKSSSLLEGMHKDILPEIYMPSTNAFDAVGAAYRLQLKITTGN